MSVGKKKVSAIIVLYNPDYKHLNLFCSNLKNQVDTIILVDNTPNVGKENYSSFLNNFENVIYLPNRENLGIAKAQNIGIKKSIEIGSSFTILFDQDSNVEIDFIDNMLKSYYLIYKENKKIASIGPAFIDTKTNEYANIIKLSGLKVLRIKPDPIDREYTECDYMIASGSLYNNIIFEEIGLMNEELFIDYVDLEWGLRAQLKGYKNFIVDKVSMKHCIGDDFILVPFFNRKVNIHSDFRKYFIIRNSLYLSLYSNVKINWRIIQFFKTFIYFLLIIVFLDNKLKTLKVSIRALNDALFKNMNKGSV